MIAKIFGCGGGVGRRWCWAEVGHHCYGGFGGRQLGLAEREEGCSIGREGHILPFGVSIVSYGCIKQLSSRFILVVL